MSHPAPDENFDDVVIGSSPLMLLQAQVLARAGRRVCVVERQPRMGGSWETAVVEGGQEVEIACHVIEVFPKVYPYLEEASGAPFVPLRAQPIRINRGGMRVPYFSRLLLLASGARMVLGYGRAWFDTATGRAADRNRLINFRTKLWSWLRYQIPVMVGNTEMQGPRDGFVDFLERLAARCRAAGVVFRTADVAAMTRAEGRWTVTAATGEALSAAHVHCTTSTNLRRAGPGRFEAAPQDFAHRRSVVVDVPRANVVISQTYVAFWQDPVIARISRIDRPGAARPAEQFLVEFHHSDLDRHDDVEGEIRRRLERASIIDAGGPFTIVGDVDCPFIHNVDQLPKGQIDEGLWGYYSIGNLAAGVAHWLTIDRLPPLPGAARAGAQGAGGHANVNPPLTRLERETEIR